MSEAGIDRRAAASDESDGGGRGVVIAHPSPSIRVRLALALADERPVFLASGADGIVHHGHLCEAVRAPCAIVLSVAQLRALRASRRLCARTKLVVIDDGAEQVDCDLRLGSLELARVVALIAA